MIHMYLSGAATIVIKYSTSKCFLKNIFHLFITVFIALFVIGLYPLKSSFNLLRAQYIRSLYLNPSFVPAFASHLQENFLNTMYMGFCFTSREVKCDKEVSRTIICKAHCEFFNKKKLWLFCKIPVGCLH